MHEGITIQKRKQRNITKLAIAQVNQSLRKTHSKTSHQSTRSPHSKINELEFLLKAGGRKHDTYIQEPECLMMVESTGATFFCFNHKKI